MLLHTVINSNMSLISHRVGDANLDIISDIQKLHTIYFLWSVLKSIFGFRNNILLE